MDKWKKELPLREEARRVRNLPLENHIPDPELPEYRRALQSLSKSVAPSPAVACFQEVDTSKSLFQQIVIESFGCDPRSLECGEDYSYKQAESYSYKTAGEVPSYSYNDYSYTVSAPAYSYTPPEN